MAGIDKNKFTNEQIQKAMQCETPEELMELAKSEGVDLTKEEAENLLTKLGEVELDSEELKAVAGGWWASIGDLKAMSWLK